MSVFECLWHLLGYSFQNENKDQCLLDCLAKMFKKYFILLAVLLSFCQISQTFATSSDDNLFGFRNSLIFGIIKFAENSRPSNLSDKCLEDLTAIELGFHEKHSWAIKRKFIFLPTFYNFTSLKAPAFNQFVFIMMCDLHKDFN